MTARHMNTWYTCGFTGSTLNRTSVQAVDPNTEEVFITFQAFLQVFRPELLHVPGCKDKPAMQELGFRRSSPNRKRRREST